MPECIARYLTDVIYPNHSRPNITTTGISFYIWYKIMANNNWYDGVGVTLISRVKVIPLFYY